MSGYSWYQVVTDGPITAPRWVHHIVVKLSAQHAAPAFLLWILTGSPLLSSAIGGPGVYAFIVGRKLYHHATPNWPDWIHDAAFAFAVLAGGMIAQWRHDVRAFGGITLLLACVLTWRQLHHRAIP